MDKEHFISEVPITAEVEKKGYDYSISTKKFIDKKVETEEDDKEQSEEENNEEGNKEKKVVEMHAVTDEETGKDAAIYKFYTLASGNEREDFTEEVVEDFINTDWSSFENFDQLIAASQEIHCVTIDTSSNDWQTAKCTCPAYGKEYICKHVMALMYRLKILKRPENPGTEYEMPIPKKGQNQKQKRD